MNNNFSVSVLTYAFDPEVRLSEAPQIKTAKEASLSLTNNCNANLRSFITSPQVSDLLFVIDKAEVKTLVEFNKIHEVPDLFALVNGQNHDDVVFVISPSEFPIKSYLEFRLKRYEAEAKLFDQPSDASKLIAKIYPNTVGQLMRKTGWTISVLQSEFLP